MAEIDEMPGGKPVLVRRELHFYWLLDTSGSMSNDGKIQALNQAIRESIPLMREEAEKPTARGDLIVHAMEFNDEAHWVDAEMAQGVAVANFNWTKDLTADGETFLGAALKKIAVEMPNLPNNAFRPVIALVTDGEPTDDFNTGMKALLDQPWGKAAFRVAIAIGEDANLAVCKQFSGERNPMRASNVEEIRKFIRFVSHVAVAGAGGGDKAIEQELKKQEAVASAPPPLPDPAPADPAPADPAHTDPAQAAAAPADDWIQ